MSPRESRARRARMTPRTVWLAAGVVVIGATGVTAVAVTGSSDNSTATAGNSRPAQAHTLALDGKDKKKRTLPRTETQSFSLIGVSWDDDTDVFEGTAQIRTRGTDDGTWTDWRDLDFGIRAPESAEGKDSGVRGASEPLWVGPSDAVEARVVADGKETAVPEALRLDMIDPGETAKEQGKGNGKGNGKGGGKDKPSTVPEKTQSSAPSPSASTGDTAPSTAPEPTGPSEPDAPTEAPASEEPASTATPDASAEPQEPTAEPSAPATGEDPVTEPTAPADQPDPTPPAAEEPQETQDPQEPTAEPSAPAPSEDPTVEPSPETSSAPPAEPTASASTQPAPDPSTEPATPTAPPVVSRADWGADESLVVDPPSYLDKADAVFVHHTAGTNDYDCAESPAIVRGILTYHVKTNGWSDVGYNFFVDKCGTVFEGRAGGIDRPVRGAHTYGFNGYSSGVSLLGDYENGGTPTAAAKQAIADISAWKLGLHGVDPEAKVTLTAAGDTGVWNTGDRATLNTVSGHRDGFATLCPGATLYSALPEVRRTAGASVYAAG
jgi:uncharacterized protein with LGFP repeats